MSGSAEDHKSVLFIGQAPGPHGEGKRPLMGRSAAGTTGGRLPALAGMSPAEFHCAYDAVNLLDRFPGRRGGKGDFFPVCEASQAALALDLSRRSCVVLLGRGVAQAMGHRADWFEWVKYERGFWMAVIPHPSPVSRWWNDPGNCSRARRFLTSLGAALARGQI